jgi:hypothetical protein
MHRNRSDEELDVEHGEQALPAILRPFGCVGGEHEISRPRPMLDDVFLIPP